MEYRLEPEQLGESVGGAGTRKDTHASSHMNQHFTYSSQTVAVNDSSNDFRACDSSAPWAIIAFGLLIRLQLVGAQLFSTLNAFTGRNGIEFVSDGLQRVTERRHTFRHYSIRCLVESEFWPG